MSEVVKLLQPLQYIKEFLNQNIRTDGRKLDEFRSTLLNCGSLTSAKGSAMVKMGNTALICGVKPEIIEPNIERPDEGVITISVELPALCSSKYSSNVKSIDALVLTQFMQNIINESNVIDLKKLCICEGKFVWNLNIEVICLNFDGNMFDSSLTGILSALQSCSLPLVEINDKNEIIYTNERCVPLVLSSYPIASSFAIIDGNILCDPSLEEECLADSIINFVVNADKDVIHCIHKTGSTKICINELQFCNKTAKTRSQVIKTLISQTFISTQK